MLLQDNLRVLVNHEKGEERVELALRNLHGLSIGKSGKNEEYDKNCEAFSRVWYIDFMETVSRHVM